MHCSTDRKAKRQVFCKNERSEYLAVVFYVAKNVVETSELLTDDQLKFSFFFTFIQTH